jgi:thioredoxin 1
MNAARRVLLLGAVCALVPMGMALAADQQPFDAKAFEEAQAAEMPILVHVTAPWCGTCQIQKPIVSDLAQRPDFADMVIFNVDFDTQPDVLRALKVQYQSTMITFKGSDEKFRIVGSTDPATIENILRKAY